jgi:hypothetical protein
MYDTHFHGNVVHACVGLHAPNNPLRGRFVRTEGIRKVFAVRQHQGTDTYFMPKTVVQRSHSPNQQTGYIFRG